MPAQGQPDSLGRLGEREAGCTPEASRLTEALAVHMEARALKTCCCTRH